VRTCIRVCVCMTSYRALNLFVSTRISYNPHGFSQNTNTELVRIIITINSTRPNELIARDRGEIEASRVSNFLACAINKDRRGP